jgi:endonuclease/exonuclease/phosphatase family metal-dependent hydrolase
MAKESRVDVALRDIGNSPKLADADFLLMQEVSGDARGSVAQEIAHRLNRFVAFAPAAPGVTDQGLAILSRYPLRDITTRKLKACDLRFRSRNRIGLEATADTPFGAIRVIDAHLDTRVNTPDRLAQLEPLVASAGEFKGPKLIGGDLNTNDMYWLGSVCPLPKLGGHSAAIQVFMRKHGFTTPFSGCGPTFPSLGLHLDWIFLNGLSEKSAGVARVPFSDHHAVWTRIEVI